MWLATFFQQKCINYVWEWLNDLFWGIRNTFVGKYHFLVINGHLWGPSVHVDKSFKKIQARVRPPHPGIARILGTYGSASHPLEVLYMNNCTSSKVFLSQLLSIFCLCPIQDNNFKRSMHCQCWEYCECESHISIDKWQKYDINLGLGFQVDFFDSFFLKHFQQKTTKKKAWTKQITYLSVFTGCDLSQYYDPLILMLEIKSQDVFIDRGEEANWMKRTTC